MTQAVSAVGLRISPPSERGRHQRRWEGTVYHTPVLRFFVTGRYRPTQGGGGEAIRPQVETGGKYDIRPRPWDYR